MPTFQRDDEKKRGYTTDDYLRGAFKRGGINPNPPKGAGLVDARSITTPLSRIWGRVRTELSNMTGTPAFNANPATYGYQMFRNAPEYYRKAVEAGNWLGGVQRKGLGYLGRGTEAYGDFIGDRDFSKYGKMLGDWGLGERPAPGAPSDAMSDAMPGASLPLSYKPQRPTRRIPGMDGVTPGTEPASLPERTERTTGGTTKFAPNPAAQPQAPARPNANQRYLDIARASDKDIEKRFSKMGGIEAIRGTNKTFWSPVSKEEYLTQREAVAGRSGVLGPEDALKTEKERLDRMKGITESTIAAKAVTDAAKIRGEASTDAAKIRGEASIEGQKIAGKRGRFEIVDPEQDFEGNIIDEGGILDTQQGVLIPKHAASPEIIAQSISTALGSSNPKRGIDLFMNMGEAAQAALIPLLSEKERRSILDALKKLYGQ